MYRRSLLALTMVLFALALIGCGPPWVVVMQTTPNPFVNAPKFSVVPTDFTGLTIGDKPEQVYLAGKDAGQQQSFASDKAGINEEFVNTLIKQAREAGIEVVLGTGPGDAPFQIHPAVGWIEPGFYVGVASAPSQVRMRLQITTPDGRVLDEIIMKHLTGGSLFNPSSGGRFRSDGGGLGAWSAKYLNSRVHPGS
ncbi:MAG: hypothetical protein ABJE95_02805 [Byssovorax sp.]